MIYNYVDDFTICHIKENPELLKNIKEIGEIKSRFDFFVKDSLRNPNFYANKLLQKMDDSDAAFFCKVNSIDLKDTMSAKKSLRSFYYNYKNDNSDVNNVKNDNNENDFFKKYPMLTEQVLKHREFLMNSDMDKDEKNIHVRNTYLNVSVNKPFQHMKDNVLPRFEGFFTDVSDDSYQEKVVEANTNIPKSGVILREK